MSGTKCLLSEKRGCRPFDVKSTTAQNVLEKLLRESEVKRTGQGKKGSPYLYWHPTGSEQSSEDQMFNSSGTVEADHSIHSDTTSSLRYVRKKTTRKHRRRSLK